MLDYITVWDDEVDVVVTGSGVAGLASAIAAVDFGGEVFVADPPVDEELLSRPWLTARAADAETADYFAQLSADLAPLSHLSSEPPMPARAVYEREPVPSGGAIAPFVGSRLRDWAAQCLATPYGYLYTRVSDWPSTTVHTTDGEAIEVVEIGAVTPDFDDVGASVLDWLRARADERRIEVNANSTLERIVFEDGVAVGAVFATPEGPLAIRARHGVTVAPEAARFRIGEPDRPTAAGAALQVCLVGQRASRFGRVELLSPAQRTPPVSPTCRAGGRQLPAKLHETCEHSSRPWRCGGLHPSPDQ